MNWSYPDEEYEKREGAYKVERSEVADFEWLQWFDLYVRTSSLWQLENYSPWIKFSWHETSLFLSVIGVV